MDINGLHLSLFMTVLLIPMAIGIYFQLRLTRDMTWAVIRMTVQLILVGLYMQYLFLLDDLWVNVAWLFIMLMVGTSAIINKAKLPKRLLYLPVFCGLSLGMLPLLWLVIVYLLSPEPLYAAQYLIPTAGMLLGNCLSGNILALQRLFGAFVDKKAEYQGALALGATPSQASRSFVQTALQQSLAPILASMSTTGLVTLPGMMTGQILGGVTPIIAIKYQLVISTAIFVTLAVSVSTVLTLSVRSVIREGGRIKIAI